MKTDGLQELSQKVNKVESKTDKKIGKITTKTERFSRNEMSKFTSAEQSTD